VGLIAWTSRLPQDERGSFIDDALTRYADEGSSASVFCFYQMDVQLARSV